jgi:hypothetical protein
MGRVDWVIAMSIPRAAFAAALAACLALAAFEAHGRAFEVRLLKGKEADGVWGTDEFEVSVSPSGVVRHVKVRGVELVWQAVALYTQPVPPGASEGERTVQGETPGKSGLSLAPPTWTTRDENGMRVFEYEHLVANTKVLDGKPLCRMRQRLAIHPTGVIETACDIEWLETVRWHLFSMLAVLNEKTCRNREYVALVGDRVFSGRLEAGPETERRMRDVNLSQLTVWSEVGPFHFVWDAPVRGSFHWGGGIQSYFGPASAPYRSFIYKGQKDRIAYRVLLPVSQQ